MNMPNDRPAGTVTPCCDSPWRRALIPGVITLAVTLLRLWGELQHWSPTLFSTAAGGNGALIGIVWLVPIFGLFFASQLGKQGEQPKGRVRGWLLPLVSFLLMVGWMAAEMRVFQVAFPRAIAVVAPGALVCMILGWRAWPKLSAVLAVYGLYARVPVIVVTALSAYHGWDTHFDKMGPDNVPLPPGEKVLWTCVAQLVMWIAFTVLVGGLFGGLIALARPRKSVSAPA